MPLPGQVAQDEQVQAKERDEDDHEHDVDVTLQDGGESYPSAYGDSHTEESPCAGVWVYPALAVHAGDPEAHVDHNAGAECYAVRYVIEHGIAHCVSV